MSWRKRKVSRSAWAAFRLTIFERDNWRCTRCARAGRLEAHHVIPLEKGGAVTDPRNVRTLCRSCHIETHQSERPNADAARRWQSLVDNL